MTRRYRRFKRAWGMWYAIDKATGNSVGLKTRVKAEAVQKVNATNETEQQPCISLGLARVYLNATDPKLAARTWQEVINDIVDKKRDETSRHWEVAIRDNEERNRSFSRCILVHDTLLLRKRIEDRELTSAAFRRTLQHHGLGENKARTKTNCTVTSWVANFMKQVRTISLFSGCGGSDLGLQRLGYDVAWANDISKAACETYVDNVGSVIRCGDIADFGSFPSAKFLVGCYPCQGFTQGGRRNPDDSINYLYQQFDRVLRIVCPKAFVVENVNGMAFGDNTRLLDNQLCRYRLAGYRVKWRVLNAVNYGVAQSRRRVFIVGIRSDLDFEYEFPLPQFGEGTRRKLICQEDVLAGMPEWPAGEFNEEPFHWYYLSRRRRRDWNEPSPCIVGHWRHVPLHPMSPPLKRVHTDKWVFSRKGKARRLSYSECAALQGFPKSFVWKRGTVRERFQMIGNAVPPPLFEAVVQNLEELW